MLNFCGENECWAVILLSGEHSSPLGKDLEKCSSICDRSRQQQHNVYHIQPRTFSLAHCASYIGGRNSAPKRSKNLLRVLLYIYTVYTVY